MCSQVPMNREPCSDELADLSQICFKRNLLTAVNDERFESMTQTRIV